MGTGGLVNLQSCVGLDEITHLETASVFLLIMYYTKSSLFCKYCVKLLIYSL